MTNITIRNNTFFDGNINQNVNFVKEVVGIIDYNVTSKKLTFYYDNYNIFFRDYAESNRRTIEIVIIPVYFIINIMINFCSVMILKYIDANAMLVNINVNYLISRMVTYIKKGGKKEYLTLAEFILLELCEILAILAYMIYIELIELKFCKLDYHLKKKIEERGITDSKLFLDDNDDDEKQENYEDEKNENKDEEKNENNDDNNSDNAGGINDISTEERDD
jgi:hypothetical protein